MKDPVDRRRPPALPMFAGLVLCGLTAFPAAAAQSEWVRSEGGDIRLTATQRQPDGTIPAILEIRLQPGWKTYWLEPGASGIPPHIRIDPASGVTFSGLRFPAPKTFDDGVVRYTGYDRAVALPLRLKQARPGRVDIKASVFLGICRDICIPVQADLELALSGTGTDNPLEKARIDDALNALPEAPAADFRVEKIALAEDGKRLRLHLTTPQAKAGLLPEVFLAGPAGFAFGKPEISLGKQGMVIADIPVRATARGGTLTGRTALLVVTAQARSMETMLAFD